MKKLLLIIAIFTLIFGSDGKETQAQIINGAYQRQDIFQRKPLELPTVREADVFWSKKSGE